MSAPALIRKQDMMRAAEVANETGCRIEIKIGDAVVSIMPHVETAAPNVGPKKSDGIDYSRPVL